MGVMITVATVWWWAGDDDGGDDNGGGDNDGGEGVDARQIRIDEIQPIVLQFFVCGSEHCSTALSCADHSAASNDAKSTSRASTQC